jgi:hypothetical protein
MAARNTNSNIFLAMKKSSQDRLGQMDFIYPLNCTFIVHTIDPETNEKVFVYDRKISVQAGALHDGLRLHLAILISQRDGYRLSATAIDNNQIEFESLASITLTRTGAIKETNSRHLNTIILMIKK